MAPAATSQEMKLAEACKAEGNRRFGLQKYAAAIESYTEAICHAPEWDVLYINRALCHKKRSDWEAVRADSQRALDLFSESVKSHFFLGVALLELGAPKQRAIDHLIKALELAREKGDKMKDDIWRELARAKYTQWQEVSSVRKAKRKRLQHRLETVMQRELEAAVGTSEEQAVRDDIETMEEALRSVSREDEAGEIPAAYVCRLTMDIFRDPVMTPSGLSYERSALLEHLHKVGKFDPVTRSTMGSSQLVTNLGLRSAAHQYLDDHPWAWAECM
uniref:RING-type E3 ubiquitin transferase n=1 Tax=Tetraselmis chuii TaxID=63592 RepID=A0A7S1T250_9CHLO|mmetsp:Transcript_37745/g.67650  ORF Transcript_37745/g.67650 Transcript_37745/m.67650 type:complete len:275 (+) Transcript_37745:314-1138(+)